MAIAKVTCTCAKCGKEFTIRREFGARRAAEDFEKWAPSHYNECQECYGIRMQAEREEKKQRETADAIKKSNAYGFPALTGTEKQVAWAEKLRMDYFKSCLKIDKCNIPLCMEWYQDFANQHPESKYWIDNRFDGMSMAGWQKITADAKALWKEKYEARYKELAA